MLSSIIAALRRLIGGQFVYAWNARHKSRRWIQEKVQDEQEWQAERNRRNQPYTYPSQPLLRAADPPEAGSHALLRPAREAGKTAGGQLLRGSSPEAKSPSNDAPEASRFTRRAISSAF